jgi:uncharacterized protein YjcR
MAAPKGNTNALKHGLYAKHYRPEEVKELKRMEADNLLYELMAARQKADKCHNLVEAQELMPAKDIASMVALLGAWDTALNTVANIATKISLLTGTNQTLQDSLMEALSGMKQFDPDDEYDPR